MVEVPAPDNISVFGISVVPIRVNDDGITKLVGRINCGDIRTPVDDTLPDNSQVDPIFLRLDIFENVQDSVQTGKPGAVVY